MKRLNVADANYAGRFLHGSAHIHLLALELLRLPLVIKLISRSVVFRGIVCLKSLGFGYLRRHLGRACFGFADRSKRAGWIDLAARELPGTVSSPEPAWLTNSDCSSS
jgi:hypothetical protein